MIVFLSLVGLISLSLSLSCIDLNGIGDGADEISESSLTSLPDDGIYQAFVNDIHQFVRIYETPIQFRLIELSSVAIWNTMSAFEDNVLDRFARVDTSNQRRRCKTSDNESQFNLHRRVALAYVWYFTAIKFFPGSKEIYTDLINSWGLDETICDALDCSDVSTPFGLAYTATQEVFEYSIYDGWNSDGSYFNVEYNKIPYIDFRDENNKYVPVNTPWKLDEIHRWQPLIEHDSKGYIVYQEHVVPHIGCHGKSYFISNDDICAFKAPNPNYDYDLEINITFNRLANLNDQQKMLIEYFDDKITSVAALNGQFWKRQGLSLDDWAFIAPNFMLNNILYESTIIVWKEKLRFDRVRPPSIIHKKLKDTEITSYAGVDTNGVTLGTKTYPANYWQPYIRTMPHSEYPSASACVCEAYAQLMQLITGVNNITSILGSPLFQSFNPYSSKVEPASTPQQFILQTFATFTQISDMCGQSRLDGGMHFTASVTEGKKLCGNVANIVFNRFSDLLNGITTQYVVDINDQTIHDRTYCIDDPDDSNSDDSNSDDSDD